MNDSNWIFLEGSIDNVLGQHSDPIGALAAGKIPAIILRGAYPSSMCSALVARFYERGLVPKLPKPGERIDGQSDFERVDIGTSLSNIGDNQDKFFASAAETNRLYQTLFEEIENPVHQLYNAISRLSFGKQAVTAYEPDGRRYGPAIFRCHMPYWGYPPHIDSVRIRGSRTEYAVYRFEQQLGGVLLLQSPEEKPTGFDSIIYRYAWDESLDAEIENYSHGPGTYAQDAFYAHAKKKGITHRGVSLSAGDMYFFNAQRLHEVPGFTGHLPRIVMATFFGYSVEDPEIFVWS